MSTNTVFDLYKLYKTYFGNQPYFVSDENKPTPEVQGYSIASKNPRTKGSIYYSNKNQPFNKVNFYGQEIWFPITLKGLVLEKGKLLKSEIEIEACTVGVNLTKTIIKTVVSERKGTVKECFSIDDYKFTIKGFLIGRNRTVPENQITILKQIFESTEPVELHGGYPELFLDESCRVVINTLDFPEVQGKAPWIRPFTMTLETDYIQDLIIP
jgi:Domain of unknown function (DUF6046)